MSAVLLFPIFFAAPKFGSHTKQISRIVFMFLLTHIVCLVINIHTGVKGTLKKEEMSNDISRLPGRKLHFC